MLERFIFENERVKTASNAISATPALPKHSSSLDLVAGTFVHSFVHSSLYLVPGAFTNIRLGMLWGTLRGIFLNDFHHALFYIVTGPFALDQLLDIRLLRPV